MRVIQGTWGTSLWHHFAAAALIASTAACGGSNGNNDASPQAGAEDGGVVGTDVSIANPSAPRPTLPGSTGPCPTFKAATLKFSPGGEARTARVWMDEQAVKAHDGPVVFYWHGTFSSPDEAEKGLGLAGIAAITAMGGIVVGAVATNPGLFPWLTETDKTFALVDEIVACAEKEIGIDERHIHSVGMSAGGLFTSALSLARPSLFASVAVYSGGADEMMAGPNTNKFAAMVFFGGESDNVFGKDFKMSSEAYARTLRAGGHFVLLCDHNTGHNLPPGREAAVVPFFLAHTYGEASPYGRGVPAGVPGYCQR